MRDNQVSRVYAAEDVLFRDAKHQDPRKLRLLFNRLRKQHEAPHVDLVFRKGGTHSLYADIRWSPWKPGRIQLLELTRNTLLHEFAHHLVDWRHHHEVAGKLQHHGPEFVGISTALYITHLKVDPAELHETYARHRVKFYEGQVFS